jgi:hypothetical protein
MSDPPFNNPFDLHDLLLNAQPEGRDTMAQLVSTSVTAPAAPSCTHTVPESLVPKLPKPHTCPTCIVEQHILTIQSVQQQFVDRGGAFKSKEDNHGQHKAIRKVWRDAKIALSNTIAKFEDLLEESHLSVQAQDNLRKALHVWERKKIGLGRVPGLVYVEGAEEEEPSEEEKEGARLMMVLLKMLVEKLDKEGDVEGGAMPTMAEPIRKDLPTTVRKPLYRPWKLSSSAEKAPSAFINQTPEQLLCAAPTTPNPSSPPHETSQQPERTALTTSRLPSPPQEDTQPPEHKPLASPKPSPPTSSPQTRKAVAPPKSILKRPRPSTPPVSPYSSPQRKRFRITDFATVSPDALSIANPSPFHTLSSKPTIQPHAPHTTAEKQRRRSAFHRTTTPFYTPGVWASKAYSEKANTAFFRISPVVMAEEVQRELSEEEAERALAAGLKEVSGMWIAKWWIRHILPMVRDGEGR